MFAIGITKKLLHLVNQHNNGCDLLNGLQCTIELALGFTEILAIETAHIQANQGSAKYTGSGFCRQRFTTTRYTGQKDTFYRKVFVPTGFTYLEELLEVFETTDIPNINGLKHIEADITQDVSFFFSDLAQVFFTLEFQVSGVGEDVLHLGV